ncbi:glycosyltransferase family 2 protein [[Ruminococcus] lactaris]|uniref:glycosyltransferase family 2 protein n=2 Tax=[Ruminococcus] lactaris TaxID=46228 RepID=UPI001D03BD19|nr:glycosyltransferase family 2 protein [[Ruminococcus] lactaris]MCB5539779.1 glycosyltransferase [[Ruminococcus] lactaris]MCB5553681.1 glycosyltransferase [[Ruminococcus] lactaris]MCB5738583.1 glycosyltransferase [[Ruminococcus] lactaris]MCB5831796.1 glycosyltransferase [[Ruminococcus] lactaris]MCB5846767.1 glycosyltransferase [[Ruminococcus] lactaris]
MMSKVNMTISKQASKQASKISIIIPAYNCETTIERCILGITKGTYNNIEVIVVDNGSEDSTKEIANKLADKDDRIIVIHQNNQGPAGSRDTGLKNATGDYIAYCDSDDWFEPDCLESLMDFLTRYNADIAVCRSQIPGKIIDYNPFEVQVWDKDGAIDAFLEHKKLNGVLWNKLIRRELFDGIEFDKTLWYWEDLAVVWKIMKRVNRVVRFNEAKYNFYVHPESMCAKKYSPNRIYSSLKVWNKIVEDCSDAGMEEHSRNATVARFKWLYGDLKLMFKDDYDDKESMKTVQCIMRQTGTIGIKSLESKKDKIFASLCIADLNLAKTMYKILNRSK